MYGHPVYGFRGHILGPSAFELRRRRTKRTRRVAFFVVCVLAVGAARHFLF